MQEVCIVIPCYNEEKRLKVNEFMDFLKRHENFSFCFVNDGSSDDTLSSLYTLSNNNPNKIFVLDIAVNKGKAEAVRQGILNAFERNKFDVLGFCDADLSTPLDEINGLLFQMQKKQSCMVAISSRVKRLGADIDRQLVRHVMGRFFSTFSSIILKLPVYDSQCGAKIFLNETIEIIFKEKFITKWLFDVEIIARARNHFGIKQTLDIITEVPITKWKDISGSKIRFSDYINVPIDLFKIYSHYNKKNLYKN